MFENDEYLDRLVIASTQKIKERNYWLSRLSGEIVKRGFKYDFDIKEEPGEKKHDQVKFNISGDLFAALDKVGNGNDEAIFIVLVTALFVLINKYAEGEDIVVGTTVYKQKKEKELINTVLALRNNVNKNMTFKELLLNTRSTFIEAIEYQSYPYEILMKKLKETYSYNDSSLFDVAVILKNIQNKDYFRKDNYNVLFSFLKTGKSIEGEIEYNSVLYKKSTIAKIISHFKNLLHAGLADLDIRLSRIDVLSGKEKTQFLSEFNNTAQDYQHQKLLNRLFEKQASETPDNAAVVWENHYLTYKELNNRANQLARLLRRKGIGPGMVVGIVLERSLDLMIGILSVLKAGGGCLLIDVDTPFNRINYMLEDGQVSFLLTHNDTFKKHSFSRLKGIRNIKTEFYLTGKRESIADLDVLPMPDRSLIEYKKYDPWIGDPMVKNAYITMQATRGCPFRCAYCHRIWPRNHFYRSADKLFEEVRLYYDMGVRRFSFVDDIFNLKIENSSKFFNLIIQKGLDVQLFFPSGMRGDILTKEYIDMMMEAGLVMFGLSLETASPRLQKMIGKNLKLDKLRENAEYICEKYPNVVFEFQTMHGFPSETKEEAMMTLDFVKSLKWLHFPYINILRVYLNTEMEKIARQHGVTEEQIIASEGLGYHELPDTLPFDKNFTVTYQNDFLNNYFLSKERLMHILPYQAKVLTLDELVQKYDSYLPAEIKSLDDLCQLVGINEKELGIESFLDEDHMLLPGLDRKIKEYFPVRKSDKDALRVLLLDLSQLFTSDKAGMLYDMVEPPLGLMALLTYLKRHFGSRINGKMAKSRIDFDNYAELKKLIRDFQPDIIGIRTLTYYMDFLHKTVAIIRQWGVDVPVIAGGPHATTNYTTVLNDRNFDLVVLGEGELTFTELIEKILENDKRLPGEEVLKEIKGIVFIPEQLRSGELFPRELIVLNEANEELAMESCENLETNADASDLAFMIYTSGSTGNPKGVMLHHAGISNHVFTKIEELGLCGNDIMCQNLNVAFVASIWQFFAPLFLGSKLHIYPDDILIDPYGFFEKIANDKISAVEVVPSFLNAYLELLEAGKVEIFFNSLQEFILTGEKVTPALVNRFYKRYRINLINAYGQSECSDDTLHFKIPYNTDTKIVPIGKPANNTRLYILGTDSRLKPVEVPGELCISGTGLADGYLNNPELTEERYIYNPFENGDKMFKTGDLVAWKADGNVAFLSRMDHQVKVRGYRIELGEIENNLKKYEPVEDAIVLARGEEENRYLCAYIIVKKDRDLPVEGDQTAVDIPEIKNFLSRNLPNYMIPSHYVEIKDIPKTPSGKVDRKALPEPAEKTFDTVSFPLKGEFEEKLVAVWAKVLRKDAKTIKEGENFFESGGNSLKAVTLIAEIQKELNIEIPMTAVFDNSNIDKLAAYIKGARKVEYADIKTVEDKEYYPASSAQKRIYSISQMDPTNLSYNNPIIFPYKSGVDQKKLKDTFTKLIARHESFRTSFEIIDVDLVQRVHRGIESDIELYNMDDNEEKYAGLANIIEDFKRPFKLSEPPLFRVGLIEGKKEEHILIVDIHHIICDATSMDMILKDFLILFGGGELPALNLQYRDYTAWQNNDDINETIKAQGEYWLKLFSGEVPGLNLPVDNIISSNRKIKGGIVNVTIEKEDTLALKRIANEENTTLFIVLFTLYIILLSKICKQDDIIVGIPAAGRNHNDLTKVVGVFVNMLALRNQVDDKKTFSDFLNSVNETTLQAYENQDFPFDELVAGLKNRDIPLVRAEFLLNESNYEGDVNLEDIDNDELDPIRKSAAMSEKRDLALIGTAVGNYIVGEFHYKTTLFQQETIEQIAKYFVNVVKTVVENMDVKLHEIELLSAEDKEKFMLKDKDKEMLEALKVEDFDEVF